MISDKTRTAILSMGSIISKLQVLHAAGKSKLCGECLPSNVSPKPMGRKSEAEEPVKQPIKELASVITDDGQVPALLKDQAY